ncbi:nicotinate-nucleotide adenylyltransferase [Sedimenticola sp.]|uniref:nicotinate-nucleotide adenylyltransferase n=1 Tax=Sedimenticola sp. TaxID=1940285 RepID=UPI0025846E0E|nr:nicotinate-nucleotide adenylyltransferase [Sedimenticola sp.]MCW8903039.1 nicotinate-nucleotide adenylyltransferase [Sedimenticola sp.]
MIGILGGTFDPIHYGHLRTALDVQQTLGLEEIRLVPLRDPPHRAHPTLSPADRLTLLHAAVDDNPLFRVDTRELERSGKSYTLDTLRSLRSEQPGDNFCLLLGSDAFNGFHTWHRPDEILKLAHLVVMQRPGEAEPAHYHEHLTHNPAALKQQAAGLILPLPVTQLEISATGIREMLGQGKSPRYLLPDAVLELIRQKRLYRSG